MLPLERLCTHHRWRHKGLKLASYCCSFWDNLWVSVLWYGFCTLYWFFILYYHYYIMSCTPQRWFDWAKFRIYWNHLHLTLLKSPPSSAVTVMVNTKQVWGLEAKEILTTTLSRGTCGVAIEMGTRRFRKEREVPKYAAMNISHTELWVFNLFGLISKHSLSLHLFRNLALTQI